LRPGRGATEGESIVNKWFSRFSSKASAVTGSSWAFLSAVLIIAVWALSGPLFNFSDTWQLIINTASSVLTLVMVFVIQHGQGRHTQSIHLKLDELIRVNREARNELISLEAKPDAAIHEIRAAFNN